MDSSKMSNMKMYNTAQKPQEINNYGILYKHNKNYISVYSKLTKDDEQFEYKTVIYAKTITGTREKGGIVLPVELAIGYCEPSGIFERNCIVMVVGRLNISFSLATQARDDFTNYIKILYGEEIVYAKEIEWRKNFKICAC